MDAVLKNNISNLSVDDKLELMDLLWLNLKNSQPINEIKSQHITLLKNRIAAFRNNPHDSNLWSDAVRKYEK